MRRQLIQDLTAQLLRADDPSVIEAVAARLQSELEQYVRESNERYADLPPMSAGMP